MKSICPKLIYEIEDKIRFEKNSKFNLNSYIVMTQIIKDHKKVNHRSVCLRMPYGY